MVEEQVVAMSHGGKRAVGWQSVLQKVPHLAGPFLTRNRVVLTSASKTLAGTIWARAASMVSALGAAGFLGAEGYGTYAFLLATVGLSAGVGLLGIGPIVSREIARAPRGETAGFASTVLIMTGAASAATAGLSILAIAKFNIGSMGGVVGGWLGLGVVGWTTASSVSTLSQAILVGCQQFTRAAIWAGLRSTIVAVATIAGAITRNVGPAAVIALSAECAVALATLVHLRSSGIIRLERGGVRMGAKLVQVLRVGSSSGLAAFMVQLSLWGGQAWLLSQAGGVAANGAFAIALRIALGVSVVPTALTTVLVPILSSGRSDISRRESLLLPTVLAAVCAAIGVVALPHLLEAWLLDYRGFTVVFYAMLVSVVPVVMNGTLGAVALAGGHIRSWIASDVILAISMALAYWALIPATGALGVASAYVLGYVMSVMVLFLAISRRRRACDVTAGRVQLGRGSR